MPKKSGVRVIAFVHPFSSESGDSRSEGFLLEIAAVIALRDGGDLRASFISSQQVSPMPR